MNKTFTGTELNELFKSNELTWDSDNSMLFMSGYGWSGVPSNFWDNASGTGENSNDVLVNSDYTADLSFNF